MRLALALVLLAAPVLAGPATDAVGPLIQQLSSDDFGTREAATQRLVELGDVALPRLEQLLPLTTDGETQNRIRSAIDQIGEARAAGPSLLTLNVVDADAKDVFAEVSKQARGSVVVAPSILTTLPKVTFKCEREAFWPALRRLCVPLNLVPEPIANAGNAFQPMFRRGPGAPAGGDHVLTLTRGNSSWDRTPTSFGGAFMTCVQQVNESGTVVPALGQRSHSLVVQCVVLAEPKLTTLGRSATARVTVPEQNAEVAGNNNRAVAAAAAGVPNVVMGGMRAPFAGRSYYNPTGASAWPVLVPLVRPKDAVDTLPHLKATATAKVMVRSETWEMPDIAHAAPRSWTASDGRTFSVRSVIRKNDVLEVVATATRRADRIEFDDTSTFSDLTLLDTDNHPLGVRVRTVQPPETPTQATVMILFEATADGAPIVPATTPLRLKWQIPLDIKDVEFPLEFADLPLPWVGK